MSNENDSWFKKAFGIDRRTLGERAIDGMRNMLAESDLACHLK